MAEEGYEEECSAEERSEKESKADLEDAIRGVAQEIEDNVAIIMENPLSVVAVGAITTIRTILGPEIENLMETYSTACAEKEAIKKRRRRGEEVEEIIYYRDSGSIGWTTEESDIGFYLRNIKSKKDDYGSYMCF